MKKTIEKWTVEKLAQKYDEIHFPEYQRDPNIWAKDAKQRLLDSMLRQFDIAPLYLYGKEADLIDCVDGRQRIGAIMAFLGKNEKDAHKGFEFRVLNELYEETDKAFGELENLTYDEICARAKKKDKGIAAEFIRALMQYEVTVVMLSDSQEYNEFNLQFARLNLGVIINSGEKLNAMVGDLRDVCFEKLGRHSFLEVVNTPERRFGREQTAAQILAQVFSYETGRGENRPREYAKTRHFDLQKLFKVHIKMNEPEREWARKVYDLLTLLEVAKDDFAVIRSRALLVSTVLLAYTGDVNTKPKARKLGVFIREFASRLKWQVRKGLDVDPEYRYLIDFQKHVTQASVEKAAVAARARVLEEEFRRWVEGQRLKGDEEYEASKGEAASVAIERETGQ